MTLAQQPIQIINEPTSWSDPALWLPSAIAVAVVTVSLVGQWWLLRRQLEHTDSRYLIEQRRTSYVAYLTAVSAAIWARSQAATMQTMGGRDFPGRDQFVAQLRDAWDALTAAAFDVDLIGSERFRDAAAPLTEDLTIDLAAGIAGDIASASAWLDGHRDTMIAARSELMVVARRELLTQGLPKVISAPD